MARKQTGFASKVRNSKQEMICPVCEKPVNYVLFVNSSKSEATGAWKFNKKNVGICSCNEKQVMG